MLETYPVIFDVPLVVRCFQLETENLGKSRDILRLWTGIRSLSLCLPPSCILPETLKSHGTSDTIEADVLTLPDVKSLLPYGKGFQLNEADIQGR